MFAVALGEPDGLAGPLAEVVELRASGLAASDRTDVENVGRVQGEDSLYAFAADDSAYGEGFVNSAAPACDDGSGERLGTGLVALGDSAADIDDVAYLKVRYLVL